MQVTSLNDGQNVADRVLCGDVAVELSDLLRQHFVVARADPIHAVVDNVFNTRVPRRVVRQHVLVVHNAHDRVRVLNGTEALDLIHNDPLIR